MCRRESKRNAGSFPKAWKKEITARGFRLRIARRTLCNRIMWSSCMQSESASIDSVGGPGACNSRRLCSVSRRRGLAELNRDGGYKLVHHYSPPSRPKRDIRSHPCAGNL
jgi:hypothetical protein